MRRTVVASVALIAILAAGACHPLEAKPSRVLVQLRFDVPSAVKTGDEVTTTLRFLATQGIDLLAVNVREHSGLTLLSQPYDIEFRDISKGAVREFQVQIRLTDSTRGRLQVNYTTRSRTYGIASESIVIAYGDPN